MFAGRMQPSLTHLHHVQLLQRAWEDAEGAAVLISCPPGPSLRGFTFHPWSMRPGPLNALVVTSPGPGRMSQPGSW